MMDGFVLELTSENALGNAVNSFSILFFKYCVWVKAFEIKLSYERQKAGCSDHKGNFYVGGLILYFSIAKSD